MTAWTEEEFATLRQRVAEGASAAEIGRELGRSRNSAIGKVHREGVVLPRKPRHVRPAGAASSGARSTLRPRLISSKIQSTRRASPRPKRRLPKMLAPSLGQVRMMDMPLMGRCRRPLWGDHEPCPPVELMFFCGGPTVATTSYCAKCLPVLAPGWAAA